MRAQVSLHYTWSLISESSPPLPEHGRQARRTRGPGFSPPLRSGQGSVRARMPASTPCPEPGSKANILKSSVTFPRGVPAVGPFPSSQVRDCAHRSDSSCPFPVKPRQGKKIHATFQRKLRRGRCNRSQRRSARRCPPADQPGTRGPGRLQLALRGKTQPHEDLSRRPALRSPAAQPPPLGLAGTRRPNGR